MELALVKYFPTVEVTSIGLFQSLEEGISLFTKQLTTRYSVEFGNSYVGQTIPNMEGQYNISAGGVDITLFKAVQRVEKGWITNGVSLGGETVEVYKIARICDSAGLAESRKFQLEAERLAKQAARDQETITRLNMELSSYCRKMVNQDKEIKSLREEATSVARGRNASPRPPTRAPVNLVYLDEISRFDRSTLRSRAGRGAKLD